MWSTDADFESGLLFNLNHDPDQDQLRLNDPSPVWPYVYMACSGRGTIVKIYAGDPTANPEEEPTVVGEY